MNKNELRSYTRNAANENKLKMLVDMFYVTLSQPAQLITLATNPIVIVPNDIPVPALTVVTDFVAGITSYMDIKLKPNSIIPIFVALDKLGRRDLLLTPLNDSIKAPVAIFNNEIELRYKTLTVNNISIEDTLAILFAPGAEVNRLVSRTPSFRYEHDVITRYIKFASKDPDRFKIVELYRELTLLKPHVTTGIETILYNLKDYCVEGALYKQQDEVCVHAANLYAYLISRIILENIPIPADKLPRFDLLSSTRKIKDTAQRSVHRMLLRAFKAYGLLQILTNKQATTYPYLRKTIRTPERVMRVQTYLNKLIEGAI